MSSLFLFLAVLTVLVLVHECGHFFAARFFGVKAEEFGVGFPPRMIGFVRENGKWKKADKTKDSYPSTIWTINWLPLGGFVRMKGEDGGKGERDSFASKPAWQRFIILAAGVFMNFALASIIFAIGFMVGIPAAVDELPAGAIVNDRRIQITQVMEGAAAQKAGIEAGDYLLEIDGKQMARVADAQDYFAAQGTTPVKATVQRGEERKELQVTPEYLEALKRPALGIGMADTAIVKFPWYRAIPQGIATTFTYTKAILFAFGNIIRDLVVKQEVAGDVSGPVGIAVMTGRIASQGAWSFFQFAALLSINLAVVNFLPIPALDGGRALFVVVESLRRRKANEKFEARLHQIGFLALLGLIVVITAKDLMQFGPMIWAGMKGLVGF